MRTLQYSDAKSHKFWNIELSGSSFTVTYGKVGSTGQTQTKSFASAEKAQTEADKLIREKLKKGYLETTPKAAVSQAEAFEESIRADPHDLATVCAYADYLAERGDPRGEFMQVQIALENESLSASERKKLRAREKDLLQNHEKDWVGDWPDFFDSPAETEGRGQVNHTGGRKYEFKRGLLTTVHFGTLTVAAARAFVKAPQTRFIRELFVGDYQYEVEFDPGPDIFVDMDPDNRPAEYVILRWPGLRNVRRFQFGWVSDEVYDDFCNFQCHLGGNHLYDFVKQMPDVEEVLIFAHFRDAGKLVALPMPNLRVLQLYHGWSYPLEKLAKNSTLTHLTHLLCHPHALEPGEGPYIRLPQLKAVCRSPHLTGLAHLQLRLTDFGDKGAKEIVESGILKRLKVLDLRHGAMTDKGAKRLADCPDLRNLERLDLSRNALTKAGMDALRATKVPVELDYQRASDGEYDQDENQYLFAGDYEQPMPTPRYVLIANPGTKRCETYRRELLAFWAERGLMPEVELVPWADVVPRDGVLDDLPAFDRPALVRLESPGKDDRVTRLLLEAGTRDDPAEPPRDWRTLEIPKGLLLRPGLWYRGFRSVLRGLRRAFGARPHLTPTACPLAVAEMFDKTATAEKLRASGVPVPNWLKDPRDVFTQLWESDDGRGWRTAYLKLNTGSSATGIITLRSDESRFHGTTTLAEIGGRFFNSRRLLHVTGPRLERAAEFLLSEGAFAQEGIPMAQIDGQNFDVRVVCVYGRPAASIFRLSSGPMTNLHLGGRRGEFVPCRAAIPTRDWLDALDHCSEAAGCFDSAVAGVDLVFERGFGRHYMLEVIAFGDFFPGWADARGQSVHALEIGETALKFG